MSAGGRDAEPILRADGISKTFLDSHKGVHVEALRDVRLALREHEFVSVIGPSGCGKSTFLRIVAGLDRPSAGEVLVSGKRVTGPGADRGMVFQDYALFPWKTTQRNVEFGPMLRGVGKAERAALARRFIELVGLAGFEDKYPHQLSGGMRQRAAVARALANNPVVLLMDEPFAAIDALTRQRLQEELRAICEAERTTVLFVTHAVDEAVFLSDRVAVLSGRPGRLIADVAIDLPRPRVWDQLLGSGPFTRLRDHVRSLIHGTGQAVEGDRA